MRTYKVAYSMKKSNVEQIIDVTACNCDNAVVKALMWVTKNKGSRPYSLVVDSVVQSNGKEKIFDKLYGFRG